MRSYAYALFLVAIATALIGPFFVGVRFWRQWRGMVRGILFVSVPFILWDIYATRHYHWFFNPIYVQSWRVFGLPIEEILFFVIVPLACMSVWTVMERLPDRPMGNPQNIRLGLLTTALVLSAAVLLVSGRPYTHIVLLAASITCVLLARSPGLLATRRFWTFQLICLGLFFISNTVLTSLPIVQYNPGAILGLRVGTIPLEDLAYHFALLNLFLLAFMSASSRQKHRKNNGQ